MVATSSDTRGDVGRYTELREIVLGYRVTVSRDPETAAGQLVAALGNRAVARSFVRAVLAELERAA